ncbi:UV radiation resistance protein and autophagy-related subunit 14-domain-containing protein [Pisolithus croceorrhizus]|nr:UV radiation resistance protein and autophagy-related subunit 14-domain-containing protein [Pisolithus croceorrhizus]
MPAGVQDEAPAPSLPAGGRVPSPSPWCATACFQRRLRHVASFQIVNLTPFPIRDAFATALSQPAAHSQFTPLGNFSDDLDLTLLRKRSRRISSASGSTLKNLIADDATGSPDEARGSLEGRSRRKGAVRPGGNAALASASSNVSTHPTTTLSFDHSQRTLERVIKSRLVETFITLTVPETVTPPSSVPTKASPNSRPRTESGPLPGSAISPSVSGNTHAPPSPKVIRTSRSASIGTVKTLSTRVSAATTTRLTAPIRKPHTPSKAMTSSSTFKTHKPSSSVPSQKSANQLSPPAPEVRTRQVPNYISPIHPPSTNPIFTVDSGSNEFTRGTDLSSNAVKVELWAKTEEKSLPLNSKGKQKEVSNQNDLSLQGSEWKLLDEWNIALSDLVPLPSELEDRQSYLPSNSLVITFSPSGQSFYVPVSQPRRQGATRSRSVSPSGYNTDPEAEIRRFDHSAPSTPTENVHAFDSYSRLSSSRRTRRSTAGTASLQELFQLVTLQSCIRDTEESLRTITKETDKLLESSDVLVLSREVCEREVRIQDRQAEVQAIAEHMDSLREHIATRRKQIQARRESLESARAVHAASAALLSSQAESVAEQRSAVVATRNRIPATRTSLISVLATIYPIELDSPSDLLYTILGVPLPIPLNGNEPAPPLSLPFHKEVTEDAVATALGYAAHMVQLLAAYMGKGLVYPVTYVGSRSLIRDNISAMVGPRMFPLFSKGVDTYRFEYGVFLLNKDIEMLMAERDLRALDMRHTLPNLKNLLLTLTDGECTNLRYSRIPDSPATSGLATPPGSPSSAPTYLSSDTPKAGRSPYSVNAELPLEVDSPSRSGSGVGSITPTEGTTHSRYPKLSLGFPPLTGFLRPRNPASVSRFSPRSACEQSEGGPQSPAVSSVASSSGSEESGRPTGGEDDDDRRTIKGIRVHHAEQTDEGKVMNGRAPHEPSTEEKLSDGSSLTTPSTVIHVCENGC